jgi:3-hydroxy acid dehydrogenase / malonic semialdehyde reductase
MRVFVTGASSGIGEATARAFAAAGHEVVLAARRKDRLEAVARDLPQARVVELDVADPASIAALPSDLLAGVDVLVNNAGLARGTEPLQEGNPDEWDEVIDVNVKGLLRLTRAVVPHMVKRGSGHVVFLGSTAGHWVYPGGAVYCASKHAVRAIAEGLRMDVHGSGVRVTSVDPGLVTGTEFSDVRFRGDHARARKVYEGVHALSPDDIAETILWCVARPAHVNIQDVVLMPTAQASVTMVKRTT